MAKKFVTERELAFIDSITKELLQHVVMQEILYYAIDVENSRVDDLYQESIRKVWRPPVKINARIQYDNQNTKSTSFGPDSSYTLEAYCHLNELEDRNVKPREGDFVEVGRVFFEITSVTAPQMAFGQFNEKVMTKLICVPAREGQFANGGRAEDGDDATHEQSASKNGFGGGVL
jgi:hypothetical protein